MGNPVLEPTQQEVLDAAAAIVAAFAATDTEGYFAGFAAQASFIFHAETHRLESRKSYEQLWNTWIAEGWRVLSCESTNQLVTAFPGGAVFAHDVATTVRTATGQESYRERESIIFRREPHGALLAIHEHLSPAPASR